MGWGLKQILLQGSQWLSLLPTQLQQPAIRTPIAISLGAIAGALSRYYLGLWIGQRLGTTFPYGTLVINLSGCLGMGFFATLALQRLDLIPPEVRLCVAVGFLGSYTTFSTYALETANLVRTSIGAKALFYWAGSAILGLIAIELGGLPGPQAAIMTCVF